MAYEGMIQKSRTLDLTAVSQVVDTIGPVLILYSPEQLGLSVLAYFLVRVSINALAAYIRYKTKGPVGAK